MATKKASAIKAYIYAASFFTGYTSQLGSASFNLNLATKSYSSTEMESSASEETPLLPVVRGSTRKTKNSCFTRSCCIGSKAARLILLWNFAVLLAYKMFYDINNYIQVSNLTPIGP